MPRRIFIRDGGLTSSNPTPTGYTVIGSDGGTPKKQVQSTISDIARPYRVYTALLTQSGINNAPVPNVLENSIGDISFEYNSEGLYFIKSNSLFTEGKTTYNSPIYGFTNYLENPHFPTYLFLVYVDVDTIQLSTLQYTTGSGGIWIPSDNLLNIGNIIGRCPIEIRVYN